MENLHEIETPVLIELLAQQTALYTAKIAEKNSVELMQYEYEIAIIQKELNSRKQNTANTNLTDPDIEFTPGTN